MSNLKIKQSKKKSITLTCLIVSSLLFSEKALAVWDNNCCYVCDNSAPSSTKDYIEIYYKFYEYAINNDSQYFYLKQLKILYSIDDTKPNIHLMSTSTRTQHSKSWAWIELLQKQVGSKIDLFFRPHNQQEYTARHWEGGLLRLDVENDIKIGNQTWIGVYWFPGEGQYPTYIRIKGICHSPGIKKDKEVDEVYKIKQKKTKLKSNSLKSSNQEIKTEYKINKVNASGEANAIVVNGAHNEMIRVYTTTGTLVKSVVAESDLFQIPVPANQLYIVNVGQGRYMLAL